MSISINFSELLSYIDLLKNKFPGSETQQYSIFARDSALEKLMQAGAITFEEYVAALDENSTVPKKVLDKLLKKREQLQRAQEAQAVVDEIRGEDEENALMAGIAEKRVAEVLSGEGQPQGGLEEELENIMGGGEVNE